MKPAPFTYHRARSAEDAVRLLAQLGEEAKVIAGGQSLVPMMSFRLARPEHLVDITAIKELRYLQRDNNGLHIGALCTHHDVERADGVLEGYEVLRETMKWVGHLPIRTLGTVGGSMAHADSTAEWNLLAVLLNAVMVVEGPAGRREVPAEDFLFGLYMTALEPDEILIEIRFPQPAPHAAVTEYAERAGDFAVVAAGVSLTMEGSRPQGGRIVLGGVAPAPLRVTAAEEILQARSMAHDDRFQKCGEAASHAVEEFFASGGEPDPHDISYRSSLAKRLVIEACRSALEKKSRAPLEQKGQKQ
ncbi:FAD binding domain-containing protein [Nesterenkonia populi]|uniref:FAD binding domain-containing protein n=1 Tax=Nesterenkonia populi TaxID=1591087 RepID=UPI0011BDA78F|nr:FAD binding domain-containing protein [Nesterenkonia populi]